MTLDPLSLTTTQRRQLLGQIRDAVGEDKYDEFVASNGEDALLEMALTGPPVPSPAAVRGTHTEKVRERRNWALAAYALGLIVLVFNAVGYVEAKLSGSTLDVPTFAWEWWYLLAAVPVGMVALGALRVLLFLQANKEALVGLVIACLIGPGLGVLLTGALINGGFYGWTIIMGVVDLIIIGPLCIAIESAGVGWPRAWKINGIGLIVVGVGSIIAAATMWAK